MSLKYGYVDIKLNNDSEKGIVDDITFEDGDFLFCTNEDSFRQHMKMRILTNKGELPLHKSIGADIEELEGMPNTRETGDYGVLKIKDSIAAEQVLNPNEIDVRAVPTAKNEITFYTFAELESGLNKAKVFVDTTFSLTNGIYIKK